MQKLDRLRARAERLLEAVARERRGLALSELQGSAVGATHNRASELFGRDRISEVQRALAGSGGAEEKRIRALLEFLVHGRATCAAASELDQLLTWEAQSSIAVDGERYRLRRLPAVIGEAAEPEHRRQLAAARFGAVDEQTPLLEGYLTRHRETVVELGYGTYTESCEFLSGIDLRGLAHEGERFVRDTEAEYRELLDWHLPRLCDVRPGEAEAADGLRLERAATQDRVFGSSLVWGLQTLLAESGLDVLAAGRIQVKVQKSLPGGDAVLVHPVKIPGEVILDMAPAPGRPAHERYLAALGRALHHANVDPDLPFEHRWLGDMSVPLAMGQLLAALLENRALLTRFYRFPRAEVEDYLRLAALIRLLRVRRRIGELQFQLLLLEEPDDREVRERYPELLHAATGLRHDSREALVRSEPTFQAARCLRAEQLQVVLTQYLRERFDEDWFRNPRSGDALISLFRAGQRYTASEVAVQLSSRQLSMDGLRPAIQ